MTDELSFSLNYPKTTSTSRRKTLTGPRPLVASTPKKPGACPATLWRINTDPTTVTGGQTPLGQYVSAAVLAHTLCPSSVRNSGKAANAETLPFYLTTIWFVHRSCFHGLDLTDVSEHASHIWESFQALDRPGTANGWPRSVFNLQTCFMSSPVDFKFKTDSFCVNIGRGLYINKIPGFQLLEHVWVLTTWDPHPRKKTWMEFPWGITIILGSPTIFMCPSLMLTSLLLFF